MSTKQDIQTVIDKFHAKVEEDPELRKGVEDLEKVFCLDLGEESFTLKLADAHVYYFEEGLDPAADVTVTTSPENFRALMDGTLRPMRAYVMKKIQIKGKIDDLLFLRDFFQRFRPVGGRRRRYISHHSKAKP